MHIQPVSPDTLDELLRLIEDFTREVLPEEDASAVRAEYAFWFGVPAQAANLPSWLAYVDGIPVGCGQFFCVAHPPMLDTPAYREAELMDLYVRPEHRNRGVGRALLDHLLHEAKERGVRAIRLNAAPRAEALYLRAGFKKPAFNVLLKWIKH